MKYCLKTRTNENGNEVFVKKEYKGVTEYFAISEIDKVNPVGVSREWVLRNAKNIVNLTVTSDNRLVVKSKKKQPKLTVEEFKKRQLAVILKYNPMLDDYHVGIRTIEDIKLWKEAMQDEDSFVYGDFEYEDAEEALSKGKVMVYSSKPIQQGNFVSTSRNMVRDYAGHTGHIYSTYANLTDVAWINGDEGQYAKVI